MKLENELLSRREAKMYLTSFTGFDYDFAMGSCRKWGSGDVVTEDNTSYFQIMPNTVDDGFFEWYVKKRPYRQFFESYETCIIHFLYYRKIWMDIK